MRRPVTPAPRLGPQRQFVSLALAAVLALGGTGPMYAAGDDLTDLPLEALLGLTVFSASKFEQKISDAPSAVTVITAADIRTFGYRTISDALRSIRGLYVFNDRNYEYLGARGFQRPGDYNTRILLLIDGQRLNDGIYDQAQIGRDFPLDLELVERIEYVPGPGSAIYGGNAFFGVINVITRSGEGLGAVLAGETASHRSARGQVLFGKRFDNGADLLLAASKYGSRGPNLLFPEFAEPEVSDGVAHGLDFERAERYFAKLRHEGLTLSLGYANRLKGIPTAAFGQVFDDPRSRTGDEQTWAAASLERNLADTLALSANLSWRRYRYDGIYIYDYPPLTENFDGARDRWWSGELKLVSTAFARHKLVAGGEMRRDMGAAQFNFDSEGEYVRDVRSSRRVGLYLQDEFTLNEQWIVNAGIRRDSNYLDSPQTSPRLALIYKPLATTTVKLLYGSAFRSPNNYERYYGGGANYKSNPDLQPERIRTTELMLEHYLHSSWRGSASLFSYRIKDLVTLTTDPDDGQLVFRNFSQARAKGLELESEKVWDNGSRLRLSYSLQSATDGETGERLTDSPTRLAKLNFQMPLWGDAARAGIEAQFSSALNSVNGDRVPGYGVINLTLGSRRLWRGVEVSASIYDLLNRRRVDPPSEEHVDSLGRPLRGIEQDGRTLRLRLSYTF